MIELFRTLPLWNQGNGADIPEGHTVLAEFPSVIRGGEGDMYFRILRDPEGQIYLGTPCIGKSHKASTPTLKPQIEEPQSFTDATQQAVEMSTTTEPTDD